MNPNNQTPPVFIPPSLYTVPQFVAKHPVFTAAGLRSLIFNATSNGLAISGAIVRIGRKVTIDETKFFGWLAAQNKMEGER